MLCSQITTWLTSYSTIQVNNEGSRVPASPKSDHPCNAGHYWDIIKTFFYYSLSTAIDGSSHSRARQEYCYLGSKHLKRLKKGHLFLVGLSGHKHSGVEASVSLFVHVACFTDPCGLFGTLVGLDYKFLAPHANGPRNVPRCGALSLL